MYVMSMHENDWEWLRMTHIQGMGVWVILGWVALSDMPDNEFESMRMTENDWESLIFDGGRSLDADLPDTTCMIINWECIWRSHCGWTCMWWECMGMTENDWEWLISMEGCGSFHADLQYTACMIMNWGCIWRSHYGWTCLWWECMRMAENDWEWLVSMEGCGSSHADLH